MPNPKVFRIETQDTLGNRQFVTRYETGKVLCELASGTPASLTYAGVKPEKVSETEWALRNAKNGKDALTVLRAASYKNHTSKLIA